MVFMNRHCGFMMVIVYNEKGEEVRVRMDTTIWPVARREAIKKVIREGKLEGRLEARKTTKEEGR